MLSARIKVSFGSIDEQIKIVEQIEKQEKRIEEILGKTELEVQYLKEYKTTLISEVAAGKTEVRNVIVPAKNWIKKYC